MSSKSSRLQLGPFLFSFGCGFYVVVRILRVRGSSLDVVLCLHSTPEWKGHLAPESRPWGIVRPWPSKHLLIAFGFVAFMDNLQ